jgi:hypothetical protein
MALEESPSYSSIFICEESIHNILCGKTGASLGYFKGAYFALSFFN